MSAKSELKLSIILERPPKGVDFGLQKGRGTFYETVQKKRFTRKDLIFEFTIDVKPDGKASPDFAGPYVQGPSDGRFVYIDVGKYAARRLEVGTGIAAFHGVFRMMRTAREDCSNSAIRTACRRRSSSTREVR